MEPVFEPIIQKVRKQRLNKCQEQATSSKPPLDMEALIRRCAECSFAAAQIQDYESKRPFTSVDAYQSSHLTKILDATDRCPGCGKNGWRVDLSFYCQYRRKHRLDVQIIAERDQEILAFAADLDGLVRKLPSDIAKSSIDTAIFEAPKDSGDPERSGGRNSSKKKLSKSQKLELIQKVLVDFEDQRDDDPAILGPRKLPASVLNEASKFCALGPTEVPLVVISTSATEVGTEGMLISSECVHSSDSGFDRIKFDEIADVEIRKGLLSSGIFINGKKALSVRGFLEVNAKLVVFTLKKLASLDDMSLASSKPVSSLRKKTPKPGMTKRTAKPGIKATRVIRSIGMRAGETGSSVSLSKLRSYLEGLTERKVPGDLVHVFEVPPAFIVNARRTYAKMDTDDKPIAFIRANLGADASEAVISQTAVFSNELQAPRGLRFEEIDSVELLETDGVQFLDINGQPFMSQGLLPKWVLPALEKVLLSCSTQQGPSIPAAVNHQTDKVVPEESNTSSASSRFGRMRRGRRTNTPSSTNIEFDGGPSHARGSVGSRRSPSRVQASPSRTGLPAPTRSGLPAPTRSGLPSPTRSGLPSPTRSGLPTPTRPGHLGPNRSNTAGRGQNRPTGQGLTSRQSGLRGPGRPETRNIDAGFNSTGRGARGRGLRTPTRSESVVPPRHRASQVTAPPSFGRRGPSQTDLPRPPAPSRPLPRPRAPVGVDLDAIDFDLEIVQKANRSWRVGRLEEALDSIEAAMTVNPLNAELSYAQASILAALGEKVAAFDSLINATRFGFSNKARVLQDACWNKIRHDPDFQKLLRRIDQRSRHDESERLEQLRLALVYLLAHMGDQLPAEARVTHCPNCRDVRLDPAQADYEFNWIAIEAFQLDAVAPLTMEQLNCQSCGGYSVEIIGAVHGFALDHEQALYLAHWLDAGQTRCRFIFLSDQNGFVNEARTFNTIADARRANLSQELDSMTARLQSPVRDVVECAIRDLGIPGNDSVLPILHQLLERHVTMVDARGRLQDPWLVREILETYVAISSPDSLDSIFACVSHILSHEEVDEAVAMAIVQALNTLGGIDIAFELANYVRENVRNASPHVIRAFATALLDEAEHAGARDLAAVAEDILGIMGMA